MSLSVILTHMYTQRLVKVIEIKKHKERSYHSVIFLLERKKEEKKRKKERKVKKIHDLPLPHISYGRTTCTLQEKETKSLNVIMELLNSRLSLQPFILTVPIQSIKRSL